MNSWIAYLQHPLVLSGSAIFLLAIFFRMITKKKSSQTGIYIGIGALLAMVAVIALNWNSPNTSIAAVLSVLQVIVGAGFGWPAKHTESVKQSTQGDQSAAIISHGKVSISYSSTVSDGKKAGEDRKETADDPVIPGQVRQKTEGKQSPVIKTCDDVELRYDK